jgi:hypothetical protein
MERKMLDLFRLRSAVPTLATAGLAISLSSAAHALDRGTCNVIFASANVEKVTTFKEEAGRADFGDLAHLFGGPVGTAVVCWSIDGRVAVKGVLFADDFRDQVEATVKIRFRRTNGRWTNTTTRSVRSQGNISWWKDVEKVSPQGRFNRVRVRLHTFQHTALGPVSRQVAERNFFR